MVAFPDKQLAVKGAPAAAPAAPKPAPEPAAPDPMARYRRLQGQQQQPAVAPKPVAPPEQEVLPKFGSEGQWDEDAGRYLLTLHDAAGREVKGTATVKGDELLLSIPGGNLVFAKE
jgi:hypothetical protein